MADESNLPNDPEAPPLLSKVQKEGIKAPTAISAEVSPKKPAAAPPPIPETFLKEIEKRKELAAKEESLLNKTSSRADEVVKRDDGEWNDDAVEIDINGNDDSANLAPPPLLSQVTKNPKLADRLNEKRPPAIQTNLSAEATPIIPVIHPDRPRTSKEIMDSISGVKPVDNSDTPKRQSSQEVIEQIVASRTPPNTPSAPSTPKNSSTPQNDDLIMPPPMLSQVKGGAPTTKMSFSSLHNLFKPPGVTSSGTTATEKIDNTKKNDNSSKPKI